MILAFLALLNIPLIAAAAPFDSNFKLVTCDGPKGPAREVKAGILYLAQKTGLPIIPIANALSRKLEFSRAWDRFQVPLPFSKAVVVHGRLVFVGPGDDLAAKAAELKAALDEVYELADREVA